MNDRWPLVGVSAVRLGLGLLGLRTALRDLEPSDLRLVRRPPHRVGAEWWHFSTGRPAPGVLLLAQAALRGGPAARPSRSAARGLGVLGAMMISGYVAEAGFPRAIRHPSADVTPVIIGGLVLAVAMTVLGFRRRG